MISEHFWFLEIKIEYPGDNLIVFDELNKCAIIEVTSFTAPEECWFQSEKKGGCSQHCGVGKSLVKKAEWIAWKYGYENVAVIAGEGVRQYYHKLGYDYDNDGEGRFMIKTFKLPLDGEMIMTLFVFVIAVFVMIWTSLFNTKPLPIY